MAHDCGAWSPCTLNALIALCGAYIVATLVMFGMFSKDLDTQSIDLCFLVYASSSANICALISGIWVLLLEKAKINGYTNNEYSFCAVDCWMSWCLIVCIFEYITALLCVRHAQVQNGIIIISVLPLFCVFLLSLLCLLCGTVYLIGTSVYKVYICCNDVCPFICTRQNNTTGPVILNAIAPNDVKMDVKI